MHSNKGAPSFDLNVALAHVDGDRDLLKELSTMFLEDYAKFIRELKNSILQSDFSTLERTAHTLKGRCAFFGMQTGVEKATELEHMGHDKNINGALETLATLESSLESVLPSIQALSREPIP